MNYNIATILAVIAIIFVLLTYITSAPLVPVAVILLGLAIIFGGRGSGSLRNSWALPLAGAMLPWTCDCSIGIADETATNALSFYHSLPADTERDGWSFAKNVKSEGIFWSAG
jgi:hypothetical protein